ncbi:MAG: hypothetical protein H6585_01970 [Flavobacteriales bacterium]|nr:hypothetical protein [Flavobacteriales bacterium]
MNAKPLIYLAGCLLVVACKKKEFPEIPTGPVIDSLGTSDAYCPTKEGTYWIYQQQLLDTNNVVLDSRIDSDYVMNDTIVIRGLIFHHVKTNSPFGSAFELFRDSAGYMVNSDGKILLAQQNWGDVAEADTVPGSWVITTRIRNDLGPVAVPAGSYPDVVSAEYEVEYLNPANPLYGPSRYAYRHHVKDVGVVEEVAFYMGNSNTIVRKLLRYRIGK